MDAPRRMRRFDSFPPLHRNDGQATLNMLDPNAAKISDALIENELTERRQVLERELVTIAQELNARGLFHSGAHVQKAWDLCVRELHIRAQLIFQTDVRVLSQLTIAPYPELKDDLRKRLERFLPLTDDYSGALQNLQSRLGLQSMPQLRIHEPREQVLRKIGGEIDLLVEGLLRRQQEAATLPAGMTTLNIYGAVGALQTGSGATSHVVQHINSEDKKALLEALAAVQQALIKLQEPSPFHKGEVLEVVHEVTSELSKTEPNHLKLKSALKAVGESIRLAGSMNGAYQLLKTALLPLGIMLP